ncbi:hypothetical protein [uncultured Agrococcus sp.]|uniref:hypothetical protein n=1 Tax=uncultured Agrococcus sp. TaxID=382258 RepID=UPI0025F74C31|nr:hypothetical protein [uncultured Agrococcus sp.]
MDNNGSILYAARRGITLPQLKENGVIPSQSQLKLLQLYDLIRVEDDRITTAFPVVGPEVMGPLREKIQLAAAGLAHRMIAEVRGIREELQRRGHPGHDYAVVFGHAVDGLLWEQLRAADMVPTTELTLKRPLWNGAFWAIHPPIPAGAGVNELPGEASTLIMIWTESTREALWEVAHSEATQNLLNNPTRQSKIPVLETDRSDALHLHSTTIAEIIAETIRVSPQAQELLADFPDATPQECTLIVAHELIWAIMEALVTAGHLEPLAEQGKAARKNLNEHLLIRVSG